MTDLCLTSVSGASRRWNVLSSSPCLLAVCLKEQMQRTAMLKACASWRRCWCCQLCQQALGWPVVHGGVFGGGRLPQLTTWRRVLCKRLLVDATALIVACSREDLLTRRCERSCHTMSETVFCQSGRREAGAALGDFRVITFLCVFS